MLLILPTSEDEANSMCTATEQEDLEVWILFLAQPQFVLFSIYIPFSFKSMIFLEANMVKRTGALELAKPEWWS